MQHSCWPGWVGTGSRGLLMSYGSGLRSFSPQCYYSPSNTCVPFLDPQSSFKKHMSCSWQRAGNSNNSSTAVAWVAAITKLTQNLDDLSLLEAFRTSAFRWTGGRRGNDVIDVLMHWQLTGMILWLLADFNYIAYVILLHNLVICLIS